MKKGRKSLALLLAAALVSGCLSGCGNNAGEGGQDNAPASDGTTAASASEKKENAGDMGVSIEMAGIEDR